MHRRRAYGRRTCRTGGFTLIEVLAALMLVAIVLPVAMRGVTVATAAASAARHRNEAAALAQSKMDELLATMQALQQQSNSSMSGDFGEDWPDYQWSAELVTWAPNGMNMSTGMAGQLPSEMTQAMTGVTSAGGTASTSAGSSSSGNGASSGSNSGPTQMATKTNQNNQLQELDVHVTWTGRTGQQTLTLSTLVYQSGNATASSSGPTGF
jgi:prepilin-type N-terminal cleavage/methylation domain-containing protein